MAIARMLSMGISEPSHLLELRHFIVFLFWSYPATGYDLKFHLEASAANKTER
jgi:hypothetical protein